MWPASCFIRKYGGSALQEWYGHVKMVRSQQLWCLLYATFKGHRSGGSVICAILGCAAQVCLLAAILCESPTGDTHKTAASTHTWVAHPRIAHITETPPLPLPIKVAYNKHLCCWDLTIMTYPYQSSKALPTYFWMKIWWWAQ